MLAAAGKRDLNRAATSSTPHPRHRNPLIGTAFLPAVLHDHVRVPCAEIHEDETAATAPTVLANALPRFAARGIAIEFVLSGQRRLPAQPRLDE